MEKMAGVKRAFYGPPLEYTANNISTVKLVYDFAAEELNIASRLDIEVSGIKEKILRLMQRKMDEISEAKTQEFSVIHGELKPEHVFLLENGEIGFIDIEGVKYFDIEFDWALINLIYGDMVPLPKSINVEKLKFYKLCWEIMHFSSAIDYLAHVDSHDEWFRNFRESCLNGLKKMVL